MLVVIKKSIIAVYGLKDEKEKMSLKSQIKFYLPE